MAKVIQQSVQSGALALLDTLGIRTQRFTPSIVGQVPIMATGLLTTVRANIEWDAFNNPYIVTEDHERVSLAAVFIHGDMMFVYNREGQDLQNWNPLPDIIGAVGFGISSGPFKWPVEMTMKKVARGLFSDYMAIEETDGEGDSRVVIMPIVVIELMEINGCEQHFVPIPEVSDSMTAKMRAAIMAVREQK